MNKDREEQLKTMRLKKLSHEEHDQIWRNISMRLQSKPKLLINRLFTMHYKLIISGIIGILVIGGSIATVSASNDARPGDILFPIDLATERVFLAFTPDSKKDRFIVKISRERLEELRAIILKEEVKENTDPVDGPVVTEAEVHIHETTSTVHLEIDNVNHDFELEITNEEDIIIEILSRFDITRESLLAVLKFEHNNDSDDDDSDSDDDEDESDKKETDKKNNDRALRIAIAVLTANQEKLAERGNEEAAAAIQRVLDRLKGSTDENEINIEKLKFELKKEGKEKLEIKGVFEDKKFEVKIEDKKNGDTKIKTKFGDDKKKDSDNEDGLTEVKVKIKDDRAEVKVEFNDKKVEFTLDTTDRTEIMQIIADKFSVDIAHVELVLEIKS